MELDVSRNGYDDYEDDNNNNRSRYLHEDSTAFPLNS